MAEKNHQTSAMQIFRAKCTSCTKIWLYFSNFHGWSHAATKIKYGSYFVSNFVYEYRRHSYHGYA